MTLAGTSVFLSFIILLEYFVGMLINTFVAAVISMDWTKSHHLTSCDAIVLVMGLSRASLLSADFAIILLSISINGIHTPIWLKTAFRYFYMFLNVSSFWLTALLYVYYCVTIANFRQLLFTYLKARISQLMPWLLLTCIALALVYALLSPWIFNDLTLNNSTIYYFGNFSSENEQMEINVLRLVLYYALGYSPPFLIFCVSAILLTASLFRHTKRMQRHASDLSAACLDAHYQVVRSMLAFFLLFATYFAACICGHIALYTRLKIWQFINPVITVWYPSIHSAFLILNYPKLRKAARRILEHMHCWTKMPSPEE